MRLFVGVELADAVRDIAGHATNEMKRRLGTRLDARWVPMENMHLTVRFVGHVADESLSAVLHAVTAPLDFEPFEIEFGGCGKFPLRGAPRVIWIGLTRGLPQLTVLHEEFNRRLEPLGFEAENRPFSAHLTLARIKAARTAGARQIDAAFESVRIGNVTQRVEGLALFESRLSRNGPTYTIVRRLPLGR